MVLAWEPSSLIIHKQSVNQDKAITFYAKSNGFFREIFLLLFIEYNEDAADGSGKN